MNKTNDKNHPKHQIIFFGNGPLADYALAVLEQECQILFHARTTSDLKKACKFKHEYPDAHGVLASFGVIIRQPVLDLFESEGIINIHPSLLPEYRGPSPIETAILDGKDDFSVSVMKLVQAMDAGPIYSQATLSGLPLDKLTIYRELATIGAKMALSVINKEQPVAQIPSTPSIINKEQPATQIPSTPSIINKEQPATEISPTPNNHQIIWHNPTNPPVPQDDSQATYTNKLTKSMGILQPKTDTAKTTLRKIIAFQGFPKPKYTFYGVNCIILEAHVLKSGERAALELPCADGQILAIDRLQPEGRKSMDAKSFLNGYHK